MSAVPFTSRSEERKPGHATIDLLKHDGVPDWCNRCTRIFTLNNHGWLRPLSPNGWPDKMGRLMYESVCSECTMPRITLTA